MIPVYPITITELQYQYIEIPQYIYYSPLFPRILEVNMSHILRPSGQKLGMAHILLPLGHHSVQSNIMYKFLAM